jgi:transposase
MEEVPTVYTRPYDADCPVVCLNESSKQLIEEVRHPISSKPGETKRFDSEYKRNGVVNLFLAFEPPAGNRVLEVTEKRTKVDFAHFVKTLPDEHYPTAKTIIFVMDNLNIHHKVSLYEAFEPEEAKCLADRLEIHYTPKHGSWLNMAEIEFSHLSRQCLDRRIESKEILKNETTAWMNERNSRKTTMNWRFTVEDARIKLKRLYPLT